jgi:hypothetical protein
VTLLIERHRLAAIGVEVEICGNGFHALSLSEVVGSN